MNAYDVLAFTDCANILGMMYSNDFLFMQLDYVLCRCGA